MRHLETHSSRSGDHLRAAETREGTVFPGLGEDRLGEPGPEGGVRVVAYARNAA